MGTGLKRRWGWVLCIVSVAALVGAACSSTSDEKLGTRRSPAKDGRGPALDGDAGTAPSTDPSQAAAESTGPGGSRRSAAGTKAGKAAGGGAGAAPAAGSAQAQLPPGVGVSDSAIKIGFWNMVGSGTCTALGIQPDSQTQCGQADKQEYEAIVNHVNANGGMGGRKVIASFFKTDMETTTFEVQAQAACAHFTEDDKVFAVVSEGTLGRNFMAHCLKQHNVPFVDPGSYAFDADEYAALAPYIYQPHRARPERWITAYIDGLAEQGFFAEGTKVGLFRFDTPPHTRVTGKVLKPQLSKRGIQLAEEAVIRLPPGVAQYSDMQAEISSAILRFKNSGINRVLFFTNIGELEFFYFSQAESQGFRPRYGISSIAWPDFLAGTAPAAQLKDAVGVGWLPFFDVAPENDPGGSQAAETCRKVLAQAGLEGGAGRNSKCDSVLFLKAALDKAPGLGGLNATGLRRGTESLGGSYAASGTLAAHFGSGRYDGPAAYRHLYYDDGCGCFKYRGAVRAMS